MASINIDEDASIVVNGSSASIPDLDNGICFHLQLLGFQIRRSSSSPVDPCYFHRRRSLLLTSTPTAAASVAVAVASLPASCSAGVDLCCWTFSCLRKETMPVAVVWSCAFRRLMPSMMASIRCSGYCLKSGCPSDLPFLVQSGFNTAS